MSMLGRLANAFCVLTWWWTINSCPNIHSVCLQFVCNHQPCNLLLKNIQEAMMWTNSSLWACLISNHHSYTLSWCCLVSCSKDLLLSSCLEKWSCLVCLWTRSFISKSGWMLWPKIEVLVLKAVSIFMLEFVISNQLLDYIALCSHFVILCFRYSTGFYPC